MKRWVALLLAGLLAVPQGTVYAEELTDGIVEEFLFDNVLDDLCVSEETEEITDEEFSEEFLDDEFYDELEEVSANSSTTTITGAYNSSKGGDIRWKKVNGASGYVLYRMRSAEGLKKVETINNPNTVQYLDGEIRDNCWGRVYTYYIRPLFKTSAGSEYQSDGAGSTEGGKSNEVTLQRLAPMKFIRYTSDNPGQVSLTWACTVNANKALGYEIQYATSTSDLYGQKGSFRKISVNGRNNLSKTITGLTEGKTYYFRIRCYVNYTHSVTKKTTKTWSQYSDVVKVIVKKRTTVNWKKIYRDYLSKEHHTVEIKNKYGRFLETFYQETFSISDINGDGIPELLATDSNRSNGSQLYIIRNNKVEMLDYNSAHLVYSNGVFCSSAFYDNVCYYDYYKIDKTLQKNRIFRYGYWTESNVYRESFDGSAPIVTETYIRNKEKDILKDAIEYQLMYVENNESNRAIYLS